MNWYKKYKFAIFQSVMDGNSENFHQLEESILDIDEKHTIESMETEVERLNQLYVKLENQINLLPKRSIEDTPEQRSLRSYLPAMQSRIKARIKILRNRIGIKTPKVVHDRGVLSNPSPRPVKPINSNLRPKTPGVVQ